LTKIGKKLLSTSNSISHINTSNLKENNSNKYEIKYISQDNKIQLKEEINRYQISLNKNKNNINNNDLIINKIDEKKDNQKTSDIEMHIEDEISDSNIINNDSQSFASNNISSIIYNKDIYSSGLSFNSKSEYKNNNISNVQDLANSKIKLNPMDSNDTEIEIINENGKISKSFMTSSRTHINYHKKRLTHKNVIYNALNNNINSNDFYNYNYNKSKSGQINQTIKYFSEKINSKTKEIEHMNSLIAELDKKIKLYEEYDKKYQLLIEKENTETEILLNILNYIYSK
jgi:hypothetical protein